MQKTMTKNTGELGSIPHSLSLLFWVKKSLWLIFFFSFFVTTSFAAPSQDKTKDDKWRIFQKTHLENASFFGSSDQTLLLLLSALGGNIFLTETMFMQVVLYFQDPRSQFSRNSYIHTFTVGLNFKLPD